MSWVLRWERFYSIQHLFMLLYMWDVFANPIFSHVNHSFSDRPTAAVHSDERHNQRGGPPTHLLLWHHRVPSAHLPLVQGRHSDHFKTGPSCASGPAVRQHVSSESAFFGILLHIVFKFSCVWSLYVQWTFWTREFFQRLSLQLVNC